MLCRIEESIESRHGKEDLPDNWCNTIWLVPLAGNGNGVVFIPIAPGDSCFFYQATEKQAVSPVVESLRTR